MSHRKLVELPDAVSRLERSLPDGICRGRALIDRRQPLDIDGLGRRRSILGIRPDMFGIGVAVPSLNVKVWLGSAGGRGGT